MKMPRRRGVPLQLPLTSMGDIAFLLTIFFILCSNFIKESGIRYTSPRTADVRQVKEGNISVVVDRDGDLYLQGRKLSAAADLESALTDLLAGRTTPDARLVVLRCDKDVDKSVFEPVIDAIAKAGGTIVAVGERGGDEAPGTTNRGEP